MIPHKPGVYIFKGEKGEILYIGKAIDLHSRVSQYHSPILVQKIKTTETIIVESELEALILEANLIKRYLPSFNIRLKDNKDYLYIIVTNENFPKIISGRKTDINSSLKNFGPFPSSKTARDTLRKLRRIFPWCNNPKGKRACFYFHLELCPGACSGKISQKKYKQIINRFIKFMDGRKKELVDELIKEMQKYSKIQDFENAIRIRKIIEGIAYITQPNRTKLYLENPNFLQDENNQALIQLQKDLKLQKVPERIEGYDISSISGKNAVGSMVVLTHGEIDKSQYRKFKILITGKPNDVGMHAEMMRRRLRNNWPLPDLIIVDGGLAQTRAVDLKIPIFGLAKRMDWLYSPNGDIIKLSKHSLSLKLLQKLRDEAHRFAINYHKKLRSDMIYK